MADVKPEALTPDIGDGIYVKFQRNPHILILHGTHSGTNVQDNVRVGGKLKMAAWNRK